MPAKDLDKPHYQTRASEELAELANSQSNLTELLKHAVELIVKHLRFEHAAIFLLDETGDFVVLQAASGAIGEIQNPNDYRLSVDPSSLVGWVATQKQSRVITDANPESPLVKSDLFPPVSCEAGIPISLNGALLGVIDVQHYHHEAFDSDAIATLQTIADLIAAFIHQHKLAEAAQNKLTHARQLAERERVASEITTKLWSSTDIQIILRTAIHELCQHLEADEGMIQLHLLDSLQVSAAPANNGNKRGKA